jgi:hypothetical protein
VNVGPIRFCPRAAGWPATRGPDERPTDRCSECGELVLYNRDLDALEVTLICIQCLMVGDSPSVDLDVHPNDPMHCSECMARAEAEGWQGTSDARLHSNWWGV